MECEKNKYLMMGYLDDELSPEEREEVQTHIEQCPDCRSEYKEFLVLKHTTSKMKLKGPDQQTWEGYMNTLYGRIERGIGWILFSIGAILLLGYGGYQLVSETIADPEIPVPMKVGILCAMFGLTILLISVLRERLIARKTDIYKEIRQ